MRQLRMLHGKHCRSAYARHRKPTPASSGSSSLCLAANTRRQLAHVFMFSTSCQYRMPHITAGTVAHSWSSTHTQQAVLPLML